MTTNEYRACFRRLPTEAQTVLANGIELYLKNDPDLPYHTAEIVKQMYTALVQAEPEPEQRLVRVEYDATDIDNGTFRFTILPTDTRSAQEVMMYYLNTKVVPGYWAIDPKATVHHEDGRISYTARVKKKPVKKQKADGTASHLTPKEQIAVDFASMSSEERLKLLALLQGGGN